MEQNKTLGNMEQIIIVLSAVSGLHELFITTLSSTSPIRIGIPLFSGILVSGKNCIQVLQNHVGGQAYTWLTLAVTPTLASSFSNIVGFVELYRQCRSKVIVFIHICVVRNATLCLCALAHKTIAAVTIISVWYLFKYKRSRHQNKCIYQYTMLCISVLNRVDLQYQEHI